MPIVFHGTGGGGGGTAARTKVSTTVLTESDISLCIEECRKRIIFLEKCIKSNIQKKDEYLKYLQSLPKTLSYTEYIDHTADDYGENEENEEEIENYKYCLNQLEILNSLISTCNINCSGFSEILCNID